MAPAKMVGVNYGVPVKMKKSLSIHIKEFIVIALVVVGVRMSFYGMSRIPSGSLEPTALIGDFIAVANYPYGFTTLSFPYMPSALTKRIFEKDPTPGDIIVVRMVQDNDRDYVKRLIGMPGDRIQMKNGVLHINGNAVKLEEGDVYTFNDTNGKSERGMIFYETLPNGVRHKILKLDAFGHGYADNTEEFVVPAEHMFLMGDNRDRSLDSRFKQISFVHKKYLIGRADLVWFSTPASSLWDVLNWFSYSRLRDRLFTLLK